MSAHFDRRHRRSPTAQTQRSHSNLPDGLSSPLGNHARSAARHLTRPHLSINNPESHVSVFEVVILGFAMVLLVTLMIWLVWILIRHTWNFIKDKLNLPERGLHGAEDLGRGGYRFAGEGLGDGEEAVTTMGRGGYRTVKQGYGATVKNTERLGHGGERMARGVYGGGEEAYTQSAEQVGRLGRWVGEEITGFVGSVGKGENGKGERNKLLSGRDVGYGDAAKDESERSESVSSGSVVHRDDCDGNCGIVLRRRSSVVH